MEGLEVLDLGSSEPTVITWNYEVNVDKRNYKALSSFVTLPEISCLQISTFVSSK